MFTSTISLTDEQERAMAMRSGGTYAPDGPCFRVANDGTDDDLRNADTVLCWTNRTRDYINAKCRRVRGLWPPTPQSEELVVCLKNAPQFGVFDGATYTSLRPFLQGDTSIVIDVDGDTMEIPRVTLRGVVSTLSDGSVAVTSFDFGYCMTVHKAQGSEWGSVVLVGAPSSGKPGTRAAVRVLVVR